MHSSLQYPVDSREAQGDRFLALVLILLVGVVAFMAGYAYRGFRERNKVRRSGVSEEVTPRSVASAGSAGLQVRSTEAGCWRG